jgi:hypothetical protein
VIEISGTALIREALNHHRRNLPNIARETGVD